MIESETLAVAAPGADIEDVKAMSDVMRKGVRAVICVGKMAGSSIHTMFASQSCYIF